MRRTRALRQLAHSVRLDEMTVVDNCFRFSIAMNRMKCQLNLRRSTSDVEVFTQVIQNGEYADVVRLIADEKSLRIIDAGANVGLTTLYFKAFLPNAIIISIEPEAANFAKLAQCVHDNRLDHVTLVNKGIWTTETELSADWSFFHGESWGFALREALPEDKDRIPVVSLRSILAEAEWSTVDLLKIDVEGTEAVLVRDTAFLSTIRERVKLMCLEVHEKCISKAEVIAALEGNGFLCINSGETLIAINRALQDAKSQ